MAEDFSPQQRRSSLTLSIWDGVFAQFHAVLAGGSFVTYYVLAYNATNLQFALLAAIPPFALLIQLVSAHWLQYLHRRKPFTIITANLSRFAWLLIIVIPFIFPKSGALTLFFIVYTIVSLLGAMAGNSWLSWMADAIPPSLRGRYFSKRNMLITIVGFAGYGAALLYKYLEKNHSDLIINLFSSIVPSFMSIEQSFVFILLGIIFLIAVLAGALPSLIFLIKQPEPPFVKTEMKDTNNQGTTTRMSLWTAFKNILKMKDFKTLCLVMIIWHIVNGFSAPFWGPFRLRDLQMTLPAVTFCDNILGPLCAIVSLLFWGKIIDRFGNKTVILFTLYVTAFHPLFYVVSTPNFTALIYLDAISSGLMWSGFGIAILNLQLAFIPRHGREIYLAIYSAVVGVVFTIPMFISGWVVDLVGGRTLLSLHAIPIVLWLVSLGRFSCLIWFTKINDPKEKPMVQLVMHLIMQVKEGFIGIPRFFIPKEDSNTPDKKNDESPTKPE